MMVYYRLLAWLERVLVEASYRVSDKARGWRLDGCYGTYDKKSGCTRKECVCL